MRAEEKAQLAASCIKMFKDVSSAYAPTLPVWPPPSYRRQTESPFFFKGLYQSLGASASKDCFLKVCDVAEVMIDKVEQELRYQWQAYSAGIPRTVSIIQQHPVFLSEEWAEYVVLGIELIGDDFVDQSNLLAFNESLVEAVHLLHTKAGVLQGDLSDGNVRWHEGKVKLIDFGRSQPIEGAVCRPGTPYFEAPELYDAIPSSVLSDTYSVGQVIRYKAEVALGCALLDHEDQVTMEVE